jgi:hypothetical protein
MVTQVVCDDLVICNAADATEWAAKSVQLELCESCLVPGCSSGGRVMIRRVSDWVLLVPDFASMMAQGGQSAEWTPPQWMLKRGGLALSNSQWDLIKATCASAPAFDLIKLVSIEDLLRIFYFQAPREFLPDYLQPLTARWELITCTNGRDSESDLCYLKEMFAEPANFDGYDVCTPRPDSYTVSVFLDLPSDAEWPVFSSDVEPVLQLSDELCFRPRLKC